MDICIEGIGDKKLVTVYMSESNTQVVTPPLSNCPEIRPQEHWSGLRNKNQHGKKY